MSEPTNAAEMTTCPECHHQHTPMGCVGDPSPSDLWAGVDVAGCDCDAEAPSEPSPS